MNFTKDKILQINSTRQKMNCDVKIQTYTMRKMKSQQKIIGLKNIAYGRVNELCVDIFWLFSGLSLSSFSCKSLVVFVIVFMIDFFVVVFSTRLYLRSSSLLSFLIVFVVVFMVDLVVVVVAIFIKEVSIPYSSESRQLH